MLFNEKFFSLNCVSLKQFTEQSYLFFNLFTVMNLRETSKDFDGKSVKDLH